MTNACHYSNLTTPKLFTSYKLVQKARRGSNSNCTHKSFLQARQRSNALNANMYCKYKYILYLYMYITCPGCASNLSLLPSVCFQPGGTIPNLASMIRAFVMTTSKASCRGLSSHFCVLSVSVCLHVSSNSFQPSCNRIITSRVTTWFANQFIAILQSPSQEHQSPVPYLRGALFRLQCMLHFGMVSLQTLQVSSQGSRKKNNVPLLG